MFKFMYADLHISCLISLNYVSASQSHLKNLIARNWKYNDMLNDWLLSNFIFFVASQDSFLLNRINITKTFAMASTRRDDDETTEINDLHIRHLHYILISVPTLTISFLFNFSAILLKLSLIRCHSFHLRKIECKIHRERHQLNG